MNYTKEQLREIFDAGEFNCDIPNEHYLEKPSDEVFEDILKKIDGDI